MASLQDTLKNAVPGGDLATPIAIAVGALLVGHMFGGSSSTPAAPSAPPAAPTQTPVAPPASGGGGLLGGLSDFVSRMQNAGHGDVVNSWVGNGANQPVQPGQLGSALGPDTIRDLARKAGINDQDLLGQLAQALPGIINSLTPKGRLPLAGEVEN